MLLTGGLMVFALRQISEVAADQFGPWLEKHFTDHTRALPRALTRANERAWQAVGLALAGEGVFERLKDLVRDADLKAVREQVRRFLESTPTGFEATDPTLRSRCLEEWSRLRKAGRFVLGAGAGAVLARQAGEVPAPAPSADLARGAGAAAAQTATALHGEAPHLARLLTLAPPDGTPLLAAAFLFFFRREIEQDAELARGLTVETLFGLTGAQQRGFAELERTLEVQGGRVLDRLDGLFDALGTWFGNVETQLAEVRRQLQELLDRNNVATRSGSSVLRVTVTSERERDLLRRLRDRLRNLPPETVGAGDWLALGDGLAAAGDFDGAGQSHCRAADTAHATSDTAVEDESHFKASRDACEQARHGDALVSLRRAVALDRIRYEPFPFTRYEPLAVLGMGGFGSVFHCRDRYGGEEVAVKALHDADLARELDEIFVESRTLRQLKHPHVIGIRDQAFADHEHERRPYFVLEYFPGLSLEAHRQQHGTMSPADLLPLARAVGSAVHAAHQAGILHRDLKPANVLVRRTRTGWDVRVIDFGLAVRHSTAVQASLAASSDRKTQRERSFAGTLRYAAPEQKGELDGAKVGPHSDVYAFGKTCLELLFGHTEVQADDWEDQPEPWRRRWQRLLNACVRLRLDGPRPRLPGFAAVLKELAEWDGTAEVVPPTSPSGQTAPPLAPAPPAVEDAVQLAEQVPPAAQRKPGDLLTLRVPAFEPAPPPGGLPRVLTLCVPAHAPTSPKGQPQFLSLRWRPAP